MKTCKKCLKVSENCRGNICRPCQTEAEALRRQKVAAEVKIIPPMKTCSVCLEQKTSSSFYTMKTSKDGLQSCCKVCRSLQRKSWYKKHKETHTQTVLKYQRKQWKTDPIFRLARRYRHAMKKARKRLTSSSAGGCFSTLGFSPEDLKIFVETKLKEYDGLCPMCHDPLTVYDIDHKIPICTARTEQQLHNLFQLDNLDLLCIPCNRFVKRDKILDTVKENN